MGIIPEISFLATELNSLCAQRKMPEAWELIICSLPEHSGDEIFVRAVVEFLQKNKRTYQRKRDRGIIEGKTRGQPKKQEIRDWDKIGQRYEELKQPKEPNQKPPKKIIATLAHEFKCSDTTINRALRLYWKGRYPERYASPDVAASNEGISD